MTSIRPTTPAGANVVAGWLGLPVPPIPKHRNLTRAGYRKTVRKREPSESGVYSLGFAGFLAGLLPSTYTVIDEPAACPRSTAARFAVRNAVGERFVLRVEHVREAAP